MCYDSNAQPPVPPGQGGTARGEDLALTSADGTQFAAYMATPDQPTGAAVLILPDVRGLHQFYKDLALRFGEQGIAALGIDYFGRTAGLGPRDDSFEYMPHVQQIRMETFLSDVDAALGRLQQGGRELATFTVGFCMGGTLSFMTGTQQLPLAGVIGFYAGMSRDFGGAGTLLDRAAAIRYPALGLFGGADQGIPTEQVERFDQELDTAGVEHEIVIYPGAPHSFFDRKATEFADASADAWERVLGFVRTRAGSAA